MIKLNKKGFTLVELLAVIVVLALLMVVVANTALPALNNAKKKSLIVYTQRLAEKAQEQFIMGDYGDGSSSKGVYTVSKLMGSDAEGNYKGSITVEYNGTTETYTIKTDGIFYDVKNNVCVVNGTTINSNLEVGSVKTYKPAAGDAVATCS